MDFIAHICDFWLNAALTILLGLMIDLWRKSRNEKKERIELQKDADETDMVLLQSNLLNICTTAKASGKITPEEYECMDMSFEKYKKKKGNGRIKKLVEYVKENCEVIEMWGLKHEE